MRMKVVQYIGGGVVVAAVVAAISLYVPVRADSMSSSSYKIDTSVGAPFGGQAGSTNYKMVVSGGETNANSAASTSYKLGHGYVAQLSQSIQLALVENPVAIGTVVPGASNTATLTSNIFTDAPSYGLSISQNANLTSGANSIPAISPGDITTPVLWSEGTTKGLGFTLTSGPSIPAKWGTVGAYKYAAIPGLDTTFYTRSGYSGGVQDTVVIQPRLDVAPSQVSGAYSNTVTITATLIP